jgi:hypothetical protein
VLQIRLLDTLFSALLVAATVRGEEILAIPERPPVPGDLAPGDAPARQSPL